jgi:hypothetical protein
MRPSWCKLALPVMVTVFVGLNAGCAVPAQTRVHAPKGAWLGAFVQPQAGETEQSAILAREKAIGRRLDMVQWYYSFNKSFPTWREKWAADSGRQNLISWAGINATDVAAGKYDAHIDANARALKAFGRPVLLRWLSEMDSRTLQSRAINGPTFVKAWRHIVTRFRALGVKNVDWVWCPTDAHFVDKAALAYYPGDKWVDWLCADGYNWYPTKPKAKPASFEKVFHAFYAWAAPKHKPIVIGETGVIEDPSSPGAKAAWLRQMGTDLQRMPWIKAVLYFDAIAVARSPKISFDWRLNSSAASRAAWKSINGVKYFNK